MVIASGCVSHGDYLCESVNVVIAMFVHTKSKGGVGGVCVGVGGES